MNHLSFEFFPPKTPEGQRKLLEVAAQLHAFKPAFFSVTYGAGGSTHEKTCETITALTQAGYCVAPHLSGINATANNIDTLLQFYKEKGVRRLVVLRGDYPSGYGSQDQTFPFAADLVAYIRRTTGAFFEIEVAAYPEYHPGARSATQDLLYFKQKIAAGATSAITQYFFSTDAYFRFVEDCSRMGIHVPIVPGIMPIHSYENLQRFSARCGAEIPAWIHKRMLAYGNDAHAIQEFGVEIVQQLCETLQKGGAPGLHFYCLNQAEPTARILGMVTEK